jgi:hypothetical protein
VVVVEMLSVALAVPADRVGMPSVVPVVLAARAAGVVTP